MKFFAPILAFASLVAQNDAFSLNQKGVSLADSKMLTQKEVTSMTTRRDTIKMPTQTPMVPWTVSSNLAVCLICFDTLKSSHDTRNDCSPRVEKSLSLWTCIPPYTVIVP